MKIDFTTASTAGACQTTSSEETKAYSPRNPLTRSEANRRHRNASIRILIDNPYRPAYHALAHGIRNTIVATHLGAWSTQTGSGWDAAESCSGWDRRLSTFSRPRLRGDPCVAQAAR